MPLHDTDLDEMAQALREHLCGDAREIVLKLGRCGNEGGSGFE